MNTKNKRMLRCQRLSFFTKKDKKNVTEGRWTKHEHLAFVESSLKNGFSWPEIAKDIPTRSSIQIRSHAQKYIIKLITIYGTILDKATNLYSVSKNVFNSNHYIIKPLYSKTNETFNEEINYGYDKNNCDINIDEKSFDENSENNSKDELNESNLNSPSKFSEEKKTSNKEKENTIKSISKESINSDINHKSTLKSNSSIEVLDTLKEDENKAKILLLTFLEKSKSVVRITDNYKVRLTTRKHHLRKKTVFKIVKVSRFERHSENTNKIRCNLIKDVLLSLMENEDISINDLPNLEYDKYLSLAETTVSVVDVLMSTVNKFQEKRDETPCFLQNFPNLNANFSINFDKFDGLD